MERRSVYAALAGVLLVCAAATAEDLESVQKRIISAFDKHKSMTAKVQVATQHDAGEVKVEAKGEGTVEWSRSGDKFCVRQELALTMLQKFGEQENRVETKSLTIVDGEAAYNLSEIMGQQMAVKTNVDPRQTGDPKAMFAQLAKDNELKLLPDEEVNGRKTFVISATPKEKSPGAPARQVYCFDQDCGLVIKTVAFNDKDQPMMSMTYSDIKLDVSIDPERFKFKAPAGVDVIDQTKTQP